jgi:thiamine-phosphate pyrophosphorylase
MPKLSMTGFYFVTDPNMSSENIFKDIVQALNANVTFIQYRRKNTSKKTMREDLAIIKQLCLGRARLIINDSVDLAFEINSDGVHLGIKDMSVERARRIVGQRYMIGVTVQTVEEAMDAKENGASYLGLWPIFDSATKKGTVAPLGTAMIERIKKEVNLPIVASGGITIDNAQKAIDAGADCISAIASISNKSNLNYEISKFQMLF